MPGIDSIKTKAIKRAMQANRSKTDPNSIVLAAQSKKNAQQTVNTLQKANKVESRQGKKASMENQKESAPTLQP